MNVAAASTSAQLVLAVLQILGLVVTIITVIVTTRAALRGFHDELTRLTVVVDHLRETVIEMKIQVAVLEEKQCSPSRCENYRPAGAVRQTIDR